MDKKDIDIKGRIVYTSVQMSMSLRVSAHRLKCHGDNLSKRKITP